MVKIDSKISAIITEITTKLVGATAVIEDEKVIGIITDGDIRRIIEKITVDSVVIFDLLRSKNLFCSIKIIELLIYKY